MLFMASTFIILVVFNKFIISLLNNPKINIIAIVIVCGIMYAINPYNTDFPALRLLDLCPNIIPIYPAKSANIISKKNTAVTISRDDYALLKDYAESRGITVYKTLSSLINSFLYIKIQN